MDSGGAVTGALSGNSSTETPLYNIKTLRNPSPMFSSRCCLRILRAWSNCSACKSNSFVHGIRAVTMIQQQNSNFVSVLLKTGYDIDVKDENDVYVQISEEAVTGAVEGLVPGRFLVEYLPFLRHVPTWFPGATSQRLWAKWMAAGERLKNVPFEHARAKLVRRYFRCGLALAQPRRLSRRLEKRRNQ